MNDKSFKPEVLPFPVKKGAYPAAPNRSELPAYCGRMVIKMDESKRKVIMTKIAAAAENLKKNNMQAVFAETAAQVAPLVQSMLHDGDTVTVGGSVTLKETGVLDLLKCGKYHYLDRYRPGITPEETDRIFKAAFTADAYLCSANAVTENGELYNVDGNSNRVAALLFGPENVIVVVGYNKIVKDIGEAAERVKSIAAPANALRLGCPVPCVKTGHCMDCGTDARICCNYAVCAHQRRKNRIKVILVGEELGY